MSRNFVFPRVHNPPSSLSPASVKRQSPGRADAGIGQASKLPENVHGDNTAMATFDIGLDLSA